MKRTVLAFVILFGLLCSVPPETRAEAPIQLALFHPVQLVRDYDDVRGFRFNLIYGDNFNVSGLDMGMVNQVDGFMRGVQVGVFNNTYETRGLQIGLVNRTSWLKGVQIGLVNINENGRYGFLPIFNCSF